MDPLEPFDAFANAAKQMYGALLSKLDNLEKENKRMKKTMKKNQMTVVRLLCQIRDTPSRIIDPPAAEPPSSDVPAETAQPSTVIPTLTQHASQAASASTSLVRDEERRNIPSPPATIKEEESEGITLTSEKLAASLPSARIKLERVEQNIGFEAMDTEADKRPETSRSCTPSKRRLSASCSHTSEAEEEDDDAEEEDNDAEEKDDDDDAENEDDDAEEEDDDAEDEDDDAAITPLHIPPMVTWVQFPSKVPGGPVQFIRRPPSPKRVTVTGKSGHKQAYDRLSSRIIHGIVAIALDIFPGLRGHINPATFYKNQDPAVLRQIFREGSKLKAADPYPVEMLDAGMRPEPTVFRVLAKEGEDPVPFVPKSLKKKKPSPSAAAAATPTPPKRKKRKKSGALSS